MEQYFAFQWHITDTCDQRCQHCYIFSKENKNALDEMSFDKMKEVYNNCVEMCSKLGRTPYFYITGGDPVLHPHLWDLLAIFKRDNVGFGILGNPFHLTSDVCRRLKEYGCDKYQLSIDGLKETHDSIRKTGSFDTTIEKIRCINEAGLTSVIMTTVSNTNIREIPEIIDLAVKNNVDMFAFARFCPDRFDEATHVAPDEYKQFLETCWNKFEEYKDSNTTFNLKDHLWTLFLHEKGIFTIPADLDNDVIYEGCNCANCHMTILPNGDVYACRRFESRIGSVFEDRLYNLFLGDSMSKYREYQKFDKCSKCELLRFCRGCPAVAYGYTGNFYSADPQCWKAV